MQYIWEAFTATISQVMTIIGPGLALAFAMHYVAGLARRRMGMASDIWLTGWIGTPIHELGHAVFCVIFGHRITEIQLFQTNSEDGELGYVNHSFNPNSIYHQIGNFFIGIGPILLGTCAVFVLSYLLLNVNVSNAGGLRIASSDLGSWNAFTQMIGNLWQSSSALFAEIFSWHNLASWQVYVFLYFVFAIGSHISLSLSDIKGASTGFGAILGALFSFNLATGWIGDFTSNVVTALASYLGTFYAIMLLALLLNIAVAGLFLLLPPLVLAAARTARETYKNLRHDQT